MLHKICSTTDPFDLRCESNTLHVSTLCGVLNVDTFVLCLKQGSVDR